MANGKWGAVKFLHFRVVRLVWDDHAGTAVEEIEGKGGVTIAYVVGEEGVTYAHARCSDYDNYNKNLGRTIANNRLFAGKGEEFTGGSISDFIQRTESEIESLGYTRVKKGNYDESA